MALPCPLSVRQLYHRTKRKENLRRGAAEDSQPVFTTPACEASMRLFSPCRVAKYCCWDGTSHLSFCEGHGGTTLLTKRRTPRVKSTTLARYVSPKVLPAASLISSCAILIFI